MIRHSARRQVAGRLIAVAAAMAAMFLAGFYFGPGLLDGLVSWATPLAAGSDLGTQVLAWLDGFGPVECGATVAGIVLTAGGAWALRPRRNLQNQQALELVAASMSVPAAPIPVRAVFGAIPRQARWFQPRPAEQQALAEAMADASRAALVALPGARGAGKSQLAAAYAHQCAESGFGLVAWINAESGPQADLAALATQLGLDGAAGLSLAQQAMLTVQAISASDGRRRLIVFDNVDDPDVVKPFLPRTGTAKVIVTTNRQEFITMAGITAIPIGMFTPGQSQSLLAAATGIDDIQAAEEIGVLLGWLPLALAQAAAYMVLNRLSYRQYLSKLDTVGLDEVLVQQAGADHPGVLRATQLSLEGLDGHAAGLLAVLAVLAPEGISRPLLTSPPALLALGLNESMASHALRVLANASLVTLARAEQGDATDNVVVAVHRLTATVIRNQAGPLSTVLGAATGLLGALTAEFPETGVSHRRLELDEIAAHISAVYHHSPSPSGQLLALATWAASALRQVGDLAGAITLHQRALADREQILGLDHLATLTTRNEFAHACQSAGRLDEAIGLYEQNLALRERVQVPEHPDILTSRNNLANAYRAAGRLGEATSLHRQNLADYERILGPEHPGTLASRNNLANAYLETGWLDDATSLYEQNLTGRQRVLGNEHPETLTSRNNLANALAMAGRLAEAITLHQQVLTDRGRILGPEHPHTLNSRHNLAHACQTAGQLGEAIALHRQNLIDYGRILGPDNPHTLTSRNELAHACESAGQLDEAIRLYQLNLAHRERILGPEHPDTLISRGNLAHAEAAANKQHGAFADLT